MTNDKDTLIAALETLIGRVKKSKSACIKTASTHRESVEVMGIDTLNFRTFEQGKKSVIEIRIEIEDA